MSLRSWDECRERLTDAELYWLAVTRRDGRPHTVPIGGVWWQDRLWFNTAPTTIIARALGREPHMAVHLESGDDVLIVEGVARLAGGEELPDVVVKACTDKYGGDWDPNVPDYPWLWFALAPRSAMTWSSSDIRNTAVRFDFKTD